MTVVDSVELELKLSLQTFDRQLADVKSRLVSQLTVPTTFDTTSLNRQLKTLSTKLNPIKVDLAPDVDDFNIKLQKLSNLVPEIKVKVTPEFVGIDPNSFRIPTINIVPRVDHRPLTELNKHLDRKKAHVQELQRYFDSNPLTVREKYIRQQQASTETKSSGQVSNAIKQSNNHSSKQINLLEKIAKNTHHGIFDAVITGFGQNITKQFSQGFIKSFEKKTGLSTETIGAKVGNIAGIPTSIGVGIGKVIGEVIGDGISDLKDKLNLPKISNEIGDIVAESLADAMTESVTLTDLVTNFGNNLSANAGKMQEAFGEAGKELTKVDTYLEAVGLKIKENESLLQSKYLRKAATAIAPDADKLLQERRSRLLKEKALPLVQARADEILRQSEVGKIDQAKIKKLVDSGKAARLGVLLGTDSPNVITPETKELVITVGGYAGHKQKASGLRIAGDIVAEQYQQGRRDVAGIGVKNPDTDINPEAMKQASTKMQGLLSSLSKPNLRGYSKDAIELAAQAKAALDIDPKLTIKFVGESGGGFVVEEATQILNLLGHKENVKSLSVGTPNFIGGLNPENNTKLLGKNAAETLGYETHQVYAPMGLADVSPPSQNLTGLAGHPYENYKNLPEYQSFVYAKAGLKPTQKTVNPKEAKQILDAIHKLIATNDISVQESFNRLEQIKIGLESATPTTKTTDLKADINKAKQLLETFDVQTINKYRSLSLQLQQSKSLSEQGMAGKDKNKVLQSVAQLNQLRQTLFKEIETAPPELQAYLKELQRQVVQTRKAIGNPFADTNTLQMRYIGQVASTQTSEAINTQDIERLKAIKTDLASFSEIVANIPSENINIELQEIQQNFIGLSHQIDEQLKNIAQETKIKLPLVELRTPLPNLREKERERELELVPVSPPQVEKLQAFRESFNPKQQPLAIQAREINTSIASIKKELSKSVPDIEAAKVQVKKISASFNPLYVNFKTNVKTGDIKEALIRGEGIKEFGRKAKQDIDAIIADLKTSGVNVNFASQLGGQLQSAKGQITRKQNSVEKTLQKEALAQQKEALAIGDNVAKGLAQGVVADNQLIRSVAAKQALMLIQVTKDVLGIQSPSKEFEKIGEQTNQGLEKGMRGQVPIVKRVGALLRKQLEEEQKQAKQVVNQGLSNPLDIKNSNLEKSLALVNELAKSYEKTLSKIAHDQEIIFAVAGFSGKKGQASYGIASNVRKLIPSATVLSHENVATDLSPESRTDRTKWFQDALDRVHDLNVKGNVNKDSVTLAARMLAILKQNPNANVKAIGHSAGGFVVEEALAILRKLGYTNIKGVGIGSPDVGLPLERQNYKPIIATGDPFGMGQGLAQAVGVNKGAKPRNLKGVEGHAFQAYLSSVDAVTEIRTAINSENKSILEKMPVIGNILSRIKAIKAASKFDVPKGESPFDKLKQEFGSFYSQLTEKIPLIGKLSGMIGGALSGYLGYQAIQSLTRGIIELGKASFETARKMESLGIIFKYAGGSAAAGASQMAYAMKFATDLKNPIMQSVESYAKLSAVAKGTNLEGAGTNQVFESISNAASVLSLSGEETNNAFKAVQQSIGKGQLQAEELRGQLAEALSGINVMDISASAYGVSQQEFNKMMETGLVKSEEWAAKFSAALNSQVSQAAKDATGSMTSSINAYENAKVSLQATVGEGVKPVSQFGLDVATKALIIFKNAMPEVVAGLGLISAALLSPVYYQFGGFINKGFILIGQGLDVALSGIKRFITGLNTSKAAIGALGLFAAFELYRQINASINTELVNSWRKSADEAEAALKRIENARKEAAPATGEKEKQTTSMGMAQDILRDNPTARAGALAFTAGTSELARLLNKGITAATGGGFKETTWADVQRSQQTIDFYRTQDSGNKLVDQSKEDLANFDNEKYSKVTAKLSSAQASKAALQTQIAKNFGTKGLVVPAELKLKLAGYDKEIVNLSNERQKVIDPLTQDQTALASKISDAKNQLADIANPNSQISQIYANDPEELKRRSMKLQADIVGYEKAKAALDEELSLPNEILQLQTAFQELNYLIAETTQKTEKLKETQQAAILGSQVAGFGKDYFAGDKASVASAKVEQDAAQSQYEAIRNAVEQGKKLLTDPRIAQYGFTPDTSLSEIERSLASTTDGGTKALLEKIKEYKELEKQLPQQAKNFAQTQLANKQAVEQASINKIQAETEKAKGQLGQGYNSQVQGIRGQLIGSKVTQETVGYQVANAELGKAQNERKITANQLDQIKQAYKQGEISRKTYEDQLLQLNSQLSEQETAITNARISQLDALKSYYQGEMGAANTQFESKGAISLSRAKLSGNQDTASIEQERIRNSIYLTGIQIKQQDFLYKEGLINARDYATESLKLQQQLADQELQLDDARRQRLTAIADLQISEINQIIQIQTKYFDKLSQEIDLKNKSLDLDKQLIESRQKLDQSISQGIITGLEAQLAKAQKAVEIIGTIRSDNRLFSGKNDFNSAQSQAVSVYESVLAKQAGVDPGYIRSIKDATGSKDKATVDQAKVDFTNIELKLLDRQFAIENEIANKKIEALKLEQTYQQQLLQIDLQRSKLSAQQAIFAAKKSELAAQGEIATAQKELEKAGLIRDPLEKRKATQEAQTKLELATQGMQIANAELQFANANVVAQEALATNAIKAQEAQQKSAVAQESASKEARKQAQELERAKRAVDGITGNNDSNSGKYGAGGSSGSGLPNLKTGYVGMTGTDAHREYLSAEKSFSQAIKAPNQYKALLNAAMGLQKNNEYFTQQLFSAGYGDIAKFASSYTGNSASLSSKVIQSEVGGGNLRDLIKELGDRIENANSRPTNLYVSSNNPTSDAAQIYSDMGKVSSRSRGL